jgi:peptidyl-prolyl cis-trans isomerase SurA
VSSKIAPETVTEPLVNNADGTASFIKVIHVYPAHQPRSFEQARGLVINDYQNLLEDEWIKQLKKKYRVKVNEKVFQSMLN